MKIAGNTPNLSFRAKRGISPSIIEDFNYEILRVAQDDRRMSLLRKWLSSIPVSFLKVQGQACGEFYLPHSVTLQQETFSSYDPAENSLASISSFGEIHA